jgi:hypothetical protein
MARLEVIRKSLLRHGWLSRIKNAGVAQLGEPDLEIDPVNRFPGERQVKEALAGVWSSRYYAREG